MWQYIILTISVNEPIHYNDTCPICLDIIEKNYTTLDCQHVYHNRCIAVYYPIKYEKLHKCLLCSS